MSDPSNSMIRSSYTVISRVVSPTVSHTLYQFNFTCLQYCERFQVISQSSARLMENYFLITVKEAAIFDFCFINLSIFIYLVVYTNSKLSLQKQWVKKRFKHFLFLSPYGRVFVMLAKQGQICLGVISTSSILLPDKTEVLENPLYPFSPPYF